MGNQLDTLLDQLDDQWQLGNHDSIKHLLESVRFQSMEYAAELCAADLEWRWRKRSAPYNAGASICAPAAVDYRELLIDWWENVDCRRPLLESEWFARSIWGDQPRIDSFLQNIDQHAVTRVSLITKLDLAVQIEIFAIAANGVQLCQFAPPSFTLGRQSQSEPDPPFLHLDPPRLVGWPISSTQVSREQLFIQRTRALELEVTNLSKTRSIRINELVLKPQQFRHAPIPFYCKVEGMTVIIRQANA